MQINFTCIGGGPLITSQKLRFTAAEESSPNAIVTSLVYDPPHAFPLNVTLNVPNPVPHRVNIISTPDGISGTLVASFVYDPTYTNVEVRLPEELLPGGSGLYDPALGTNIIPANPDRRGWQWWVSIRSVGGELHSSEYTQTESAVGLGVDGAEITIADFAFYEPDFVFIHFVPKVSTSTPVFTYLNLFTDILVPTWDGSWAATMDATWYRKVIELITPAPAPTVNMLPLASVPDNTLLVFSTVMGGQKGATLVASGTEQFKLMNGDFPRVYIGEGEVVWVLRKGDGWHVVNNWHGMAEAGELTEDYINNRPNRIVFNGQGLVVGGVPSPIPRANYPRVVWFVTNRLPAGMLITKAARDAGGDALAGYWAQDATNIYAPDHQGVSTRALPGTRGNDADRTNASLPGSYAADKGKRHKHFTIVNRSIVSGGFPTPVSVLRALVWNFNKTSGGGKESFYGVGGDDNEVPTISPTDEGGESIENTVKNVAVYRGCKA